MQAPFYTSFALPNFQSQKAKYQKVNRPISKPFQKYFCAYQVFHNGFVSNFKLKGQFLVTEHQNSQCTQSASPATALGQGTLTLANQRYRTVRGSQLKTHAWVVGYCWNCLDQPILIAEPKILLTEFRHIHHRLENCIMCMCSMLLACKNII